MSLRSTSFSPPLELILDSVRNPKSVKKRPYFPNNFDEITALKLARFHRLLPWLWRFVKRHSIGSTYFHDQIAALMRKEKISAQLRDIELSMISQQFIDKDIAHIVFKGASIEKLFYRDFLQDRHSDDIDLLIHATDLSDAYKVLVSKGYRCRKSSNLDKLSLFLTKHQNLYRWRDVGFEKKRATREKIDLHWRIADSFTLPVNTSELLEKHSVMRIGDNRVPCMPFNELFVYVCVHGYLDYFFRLRYLLDIHCAMQQSMYNDSEIVDLATKWGVLDIVNNSIATCRHFFDKKDVVENNYSNYVMTRYEKFGGFPMRSHPNRGKWSAKDKRRYLRNQIRFRSDKSFWYSPILARCKYNDNMVESLPKGVSPYIWYPFALFKRALKVDYQDT